MLAGAQRPLDTCAVKILADIGVVVEGAAFMDSWVAAEQIGAPRAVSIDQAYEIVALAHIAGIARGRETRAK